MCLFVCIACNFSRWCLQDANPSLLTHHITFPTPAVARLDLEDFGLNSTRLVDLSVADPTYGGYSGGFVDGVWACFK